MPNELCNYGGYEDNAATVEAHDDGGTWYSRCHCGVITCEAGTFEEAAQALIDHRAR